MTRSQIVALFGAPDEQGEGAERPWIKFKRPEAQIHFEFAKGGAIYMVTLMRPDWSPGT
jgi:hypothetical protein